jgi:glucose dehydrogenase
MIWNQLRTLIVTRQILTLAIVFVGIVIAIWGSYLVYKNGSPFYILIGTGFLMAGMALRSK